MAHGEILVRLVKRVEANFKNIFEMREDLWNRIS